MRKAIPLGVVDYETLKNQNYFLNTHKPQVSEN